MSSTGNYFQYMTFGLGSFIDKTLYKKRREVFDCFMKEMKITEKDTILDVGVSDEDHLSSNLLEKLYQYEKSNITAVGIHDFKHLEKIYPGLVFVKADGRNLPFADNSFDYVYSHAVLEHTGSRAAQLVFLSETLRCANKGIFITTPNRLHPIEFHTAIPLIHYLPHKWYRKIYLMLGKKFYAREENLNLLTTKEILELAYSLEKDGKKIKMCATKFLGLKANLILIIKKN